MLPARNLLNSDFITKASSTALLLLVLVSSLVCWRFNLSHDGFWFLRAALFQVAFLVLVWRQCLHIGRKWLRECFGILAAEIIAVYSAARVVCFYYQGESFNEEFLFHFNRQTIEFGIQAFPGLVFLAIGFLLLVGLAGYYSVYKTRPLPAENRTFLIVPGLLLSLVIDPDVTAIAEYNMRDANSRDIELATIDWDALGLHREALYKRTDEITAGKNVVMIYLEGLEQMYTEPDIFPGLTPFLTSLEGSALHFENMYQGRGSTFTVAGILSSQCGTPLLFPQGPNGNDILRNGFLQEGFCLGDILHAGGYRQVFMGGASKRFAGKGVFLADHGYDEVLGRDDLLPLMQDKTYVNNWGLYDDTLLDFAADKFDVLAADTDTPFNLTVLTVDTHPPEGTVSASCTPYEPIDNNMFDAIHCTDQLVEKFIDHMMQSPAWPNTVVLVMSDHLHMRNASVGYYPGDYDRRLLVNILNAGPTGIVQARGLHTDIAPTLLNLMGVRHQQVFLAGSDMLAPDKDAHWVDPENGFRERAIRYINTNLLSRIETGLCEADPLYSYTDNTLRIAGRKFDLSLGGRALPMETIGTTSALVTLVNNDGRVGLTFPVALNNLSYVLFQFRNQSFLVMTSYENFRHIDPDTEEYEGLGLFFGNLQDMFMPLETGFSLQTGFNADADCGSLLEKARTLRDEIELAALGAICEFQVPAGTVWSEAQGSLTLDSVAYADQRFRAVLQRIDRGWYAVTTLNELPLERPPESCDAYYGSQEILIPGIMTDNGPASMTLKKVPGVTLTFEPGDVAPFPTGD